MRSNEASTPAARRLPSCQQASKGTVSDIAVQCPSPGRASEWLARFHSSARDQCQKKGPVHALAPCKFWERMPERQRKDGSNLTMLQVRNGWDWLHLMQAPRSFGQQPPQTNSPAQPDAPDSGVTMECIAIFGHLAVMAGNHGANLASDELDAIVANLGALATIACGSQGRNSGSSHQGRQSQ